MHRCLTFAVVATLGALPFAARGDAIADGQQVARAFLSGQTQAVWAQTTPEMQAALGSPEALDAVQTDLMKAFGTEQAVLSERVERRSGREVYIRISRWRDAPGPIEMTVAFDQGGQIAGFFVRPQPVAAPSSHLDYHTKAELRLPFEGVWHVFWGGREIADNYHAADAGQRFALDLLVMQEGASHAGDPAILASYHCWDHAILSPAEGTVATVVDDLPDQPIGSSDPSHPAGNHVVIDFGNGEFGFLAHLRQGSVAVAEGDRVSAGQEIGRCGNSGNSTEPHLHFHLQTSPALGQGEGLPAQFIDYYADGVMVERGEPRKGESIRPAD
jgi:hypothetical protein